MPTHNTYRYTLGVVFEGVGSSVAKTGGLAWAYGPAPSGSSNYEWKGNHLARLPESISTTVNPLSGEYSTSAFDFELHLNDEVATTFLYQSTEPIYKLGASGLTTTSQTAIKIVDLAGNNVTTLANTAVWVGDECILLGAHAGAGVYGTGGSPSVRAYWDTQAGIYPADTYVHMAPNYWRHRGVKLVLHDRDDATERTLWRGWVDSMGTSSDGTTLAISCNELLASLTDAVVNRGVDIGKIEPFGRIFTSAENDGGTWLGVGYLTYTGRVRKAVAGTTYTSWLQVNDGLFGTTYTVNSGRTQRTIGASPGAILGSLADTDAQEKVKKINEVFFVDSTRPTSSSTGALTYHAHPLEITMALLTSTRSDTVNVGTEAWDALAGNFALGIPLTFFDTSAIADVIAATTDVKIGRLLLGWDGETVSVMEVIREKLLKPYGFYLAITEDGLISFKRLELFSISQLNTAQSVDVSAYPTQLQWSAARSNAVQQVVAEIGELPWRDPDVTTVVGRDNTLTDSLRSGLFGELSTYNLDFTTQDDRDAVQGVLIDRLKYAYWAMPRLTITVGDSGVTGSSYDMGALISPIIDTYDGWLVDKDGARVNGTAGGLATQADDQFAGIIVGRQLNLANMTYTLELLLTNYRQGGASYLRAPSGVVNGAPSGANVTLEQNTFHATGRDATRFTAGQAVYFTTAYGEIVESGFLISSVEGAGNNIITLDSSPTLVSSGHIMRLEDFDNKAGSDLYNYLADTNGTLGASAADGRKWG